MRIALLPFLFASFPALLEGQDDPTALRLPNILANGMIVESGAPIPVRGWAAAGAEVTVALDDAKPLAARAGADGTWSVELPPLAAGKTAHRIRVKSGGQERTIEDILAGTVWLCSGQSNMEWTVKRFDGAAEEIAGARYPEIRMFSVKRTASAEPQTDAEGAWIKGDSAAIEEFSACGWYFGRALHRELGIPIGLVNSSWGGTPIESWMSRGSLEAIADAAAILERAKDEKTGGAWRAAHLYNAMIAPISFIPIRGTIWYQGESNVARAAQYRQLLPAMITQWRAAFQRPDFPFLIVQIAPFRYEKAPQLGRNAAELREAQSLAAKTVRNAGLIVTTDVGNVSDIHPRDKKTVGERLALAALAKAYGKDVVHSGPVFRALAAEGATLRIRLDYAEGLKSRDGKPLAGFEIAEKDGDFVPAEARIDGTSVIVSAASVAKPAAVRFAFTDDAIPNLVNGAGLPADPFRTDDRPALTRDAR